MTAFVGVNTDSLGAGTHTFNSSDAPTGSEFVLIHLRQTGILGSVLGQVSGGGSVGTAGAGLYGVLLWYGTVADMPVDLETDQSVDVTIVGYTDARVFDGLWPHSGLIFPSDISQISNTVAPLEQFEIAPDPFDLAARSAATFSVVEIVATNGSLSISGSPTFTPTVTSRHVGTSVAVADDLNKTLPATTRGLRYDLGGTYSYGCSPLILLPGTVPTRGRRGLGLVHTGRR